MQPGAAIKEVFDRLCRAASKIEEFCKFAHDEHLGYITSCPTNLGTALRGSVHIKLPKLMKQKKNSKKLQINTTFKSEVSTENTLRQMTEHLIFQIEEDSEDLRET